MHTIGLALFVFVVLPELDVVKGAMITNCVAFIPAVLGKIILIPMKGTFDNDVKRPLQLWGWGPVALNAVVPKGVKYHWIDLLYVAVS